MKHNKYKFKKEGIDLFIAEMIMIKYPGNIELGNHVALDNFISFSASAKIGDYVHIAPSVSIIGGIDSELIMGNFSGISANSTIICGSDDFTKGMLNPQVPIEYRQPKIGKIIIKDFACVGVGGIVFPGVTLGEGSVIGAGSVVTKDTEPWGIYLGSPAKLIGQRDKAPILNGAKKLGYEIK
jgi:galactoside O-acetyltransferase